MSSFTVLILGFLVAGSLSVVTWPAGKKSLSVGQGSNFKTVLFLFLTISGLLLDMQVMEESCRDYLFRLWFAILIYYI